MRIWIAALLAAAPALANAQQPEADADKPVSRAELDARLEADFADLDADKDGVVTAAEIRNRLVKSAEAKIEAIRKERDAAFAALDSNGDGSISKAEFNAKAKLPTAREPDPKPFLDRFDADKDGKISKAEFRAPTLANFERLDSNKDGVISEAELRRPAPAAAASPTTAAPAAPAASTTAKKPSFKKTPPIRQ